jgi:hypothetical protein
VYVSDALMRNSYIRWVVKVLINGHNNDVIRIKDIRRVVGVHNTIDEFNWGHIGVDSEEVNHLATSL